MSSNQEMYQYISDVRRCLEDINNLLSVMTDELNREAGTVNADNLITIVDQCDDDSDVSITVSPGTPRGSLSECSYNSSHEYFCEDSPQSPDQSPDYSSDSDIEIIEID